MVGLGKLGLPVALALLDVGHFVTGWDTSGERCAQIDRCDVPESAYEQGLDGLLRDVGIRMDQLSDLELAPEIILIAVQTPHQPEFEGCVPFDREPEDFDYTALWVAVNRTVATVKEKRWDPLIVVISTCLPGTFDRELRSMLRGLRFAYHPLFIAMGSVIEDFRNPEFILIGSDDATIPQEMMDMYSPIYPANYPIIRMMSIISAELTKVAYNVAIGYKLMLANGIGELSDKVGANCDDVMGTLKFATDRLVSTRYMDAGGGDGGPCHPRDQIALSHLARRVGLSHDTFNVVIRAREQHARWLADIWCDEADLHRLPMCMLGDEYKANSELRTGSAARLVMHYARARGRDPFMISEVAMTSGCFFLSVPHDWVLEDEYKGVLIDPWGVYPDRDGLHVVRPGRRRA